MGLDLVELVLRVEREFDITLEDDALSTTRTVGDLVELVSQRADTTIWPRERLVSRTRVIVAEETGHDVDNVRLGSRFVEDLNCG